MRLCCARGAGDFREVDAPELHGDGARNQGDRQLARYVHVKNPD